MFTKKYVENKIKKINLKYSKIFLIRYSSAKNIRVIDRVKYIIYISKKKLFFKYYMEK